jgi:hypothetical protein
MEGSSFFWAMAVDTAKQTGIIHIAKVPTTRLLDKFCVFCNERKFY